MSEHAGAELRFRWTEEVLGQAPTMYSDPRYQSLLAAHDGTAARVLKCDSARGTACLPLLVRELGQGYREAYSAYGYGGTVGELTLFESDLHALRAFLARDGIVAAFVRHAPFLANHRYWPAACLELNRHTYAAQLSPAESFEDFLRGLAQKLRWSVQFARRSGLAVTFHDLATCPQERIRAFYRLYVTLMRGKGTGDYYLFSEDFFCAHAHALGGSCELAEIVDPATGELVAGSLFLLDSGQWVHYHLSAANPAAMKQQAMELLLASALHRYGNRGFRRLHLGGGHSLDESDGLSRFKRKFAGERLDFFCSKLVCDQAGYQEERARLPLVRPSFFLVGDARGPQVAASPGANAKFEACLP